jgi:hypothetical protein
MTRDILIKDVVDLIYKSIGLVAYIFGMWYFISTGFFKEITHTEPSILEFICVVCGAISAALTIVVIAIIVLIICSDIKDKYNEIKDKVIIKGDTP